MTWPPQQPSPTLIPARHVVNRAMADGDVPGQVYIHSGSLLFHPPGQVNQAVIDQAICRVVGRAWTRGAVKVLELVHLAVVEQRVACRLGVSDKTDPARPGFGNVAAADRDPAVVIVHKNGVAADLVQKTILQRTVFRALEEHRPATVDGPVRAQERFPGVHHRACRLTKSQAPENDDAHRVLVAAAKLDQAAEPRGFHGRCGQVQPGRRVKVEGVRFGVEEPLAGSIEFLKNVLHEANLRVCRAAPVVLPPTFLRQSALRVLARDAPGEVTPEGWMHAHENSPPPDQPNAQLVPAKWRSAANPSKYCALGS